MSDAPSPATVFCRSTAASRGCGHPVDWHTGPRTVAPHCDCCSWRQNDPSYVHPPAPPRVVSPAPGFTAEKWSTMNRRERRAAMKGYRRGQV